MANSFFENLLYRIMDLFDPSDSEGDKKRLLKNINKNLTRTNTKFYKYSSNEALPQIAKFFFDLYKIVGHTQNLCKNTRTSNALKNIVIDYYLTDEQKELENKFREDVIFESAKKTPRKELELQVKHDLEIYLHNFNDEKIHVIDSTYTKLVLFLNFCNFDYYFFLRKFDISITEYNFTNILKFETIRADTIANDLKDFTTVAWSLPLEDDWTDVLGLIKKSCGSKSISPNTWNKVLQRLNKFRDQTVFEMIIQLIEKDPGYKTVITDKQEYIIDDHLNTLKRTIETTLKKIQSEYQNSKVDEELNKIFGTTDVVRLKYYSDMSNQSFERKSISGYTFCAPLNYLKAFLIDYHKKNVREFADLVLVRGQWTSTSLATPLSDTYHELLSISEKITEFDNELGEEGALGIKIKTYLARADRDKEAKNILTTLIEDINKNAYNMLILSTKNLTIVAQNTKSLLEDFERKFPEMVINWAELERFVDANTSIKEQGIDVYKKIFYFITLMKFFLTKEKEKEKEE